MKIVMRTYTDEPILAVVALDEARLAEIHKKQDTLKKLKTQFPELTDLIFKNDWVRYFESDELMDTKPCLTTLRINEDDGIEGEDLSDVGHEMRITEEWVSFSMYLEDRIATRIETYAIDNEMLSGVVE